MIRRIGLIVALVVLAGSANAQVGYDDFLMIGTASYVTATAKETGEMIDGAGAAITIESVGSSDPVSFGMAFAYMTFDFEFNDNLVVKKQTVNSYPLYIQGKYWFGKSRLQAYIGGAFGVYFSQLKTTVVTGDTETTVGISGTGLGVPVGVALGLTKKAFINFNYTLNVLFDNDYLENGLIHSAGIGIGFNFGN